MHSSKKNDATSEQGEIIHGKILAYSTSFSNDRARENYTYYKQKGTNLNKLESTTDQASLLSKSQAVKEVMSKTYSNQLANTNSTSQANSSGNYSLASIEINEPITPYKQQNLNQPMNTLEVNFYCLVGGLCLFFLGLWTFSIPDSNDINQPPIDESTNDISRREANLWQLFAKWTRNIIMPVSLMILGANFIVTSLISLLCHIGGKNIRSRAGISELP